MEPRDTSQHRDEPGDPLTRGALPVSKQHAEVTPTAVSKPFRGAGKLDGGVVDTRTLRQPLLTLGLCLVIALAPYFSGDLYYRSVAVQVFIYIALAVSYQLLFGYARLVSFGHAAFFGLSAYTSAVLISKYDVPHVVAWVLGVALTALVALVAGRIVIRLEPLLLAVATLAFSQIVVLVVSSLPDVTGGQNGLVTKPLTVGGLATADFNYWFVAIGMLLIVGSTIALVRSPFGRLLLAVGDDPIAARSLGANATRVLVFTFVLSSALAGLAGILMTQATAVLAPETIGLDTSILILAMIAVGGLRSIPGAVLGAVALSLIPVVFASLQQGAILLYGAIILFVFVVSPDGLTALPKILAQPTRKRAR